MACNGAPSVIGEAKRGDEDIADDGARKGRGLNAVGELTTAAGGSGPHCGGEGAGE